MASRSPIFSMVFGVTALLAAFGRSWQTSRVAAASTGEVIIRQDASKVRGPPSPRTASADTVGGVHVFTGSGLIDRYNGAGDESRLQARCAWRVPVAHVL